MSDQSLPLKRYHLSYDFSGGHRYFSFTELTEFCLALDRATEDEYVLQHTISFYTEVKK